MWTSLSLIVFQKSQIHLKFDLGQFILLKYKIYLLKIYQRFLSIIFSKTITKQSLHQNMANMTTPVTGFIVVNAIHEYGQVTYPLVVFLS
jgi:hypothetical protein